MLGIRFSWHGRDGCSGEMSRNAMNIYIVHLIFRERDQSRVSRTFFLLLPPMLSQTGIFGPTQYWSQSNSMALFSSITCVSQQFWQYLGSLELALAWHKFLRPGAHHFLLFVTSFAYYSLEIHRIYSSPEVKHVRTGLARPGKICSITWALELSWKQKE